MPLARGYIAAERSKLHPKTSQIMHGQPDTLHLVLPFFSNCHSFLDVSDPVKRAKCLF